MANLVNNQKKKRLQLTIRPSDVEKFFGECGDDATLVLVKHWVKLGRKSESLVSKMESQIEALDERLQKKMDSQHKILADLIQEKVKSTSNKVETQMDTESELKSLGERIKNVEADMISLKEELSKITDLHLHTAKLITLTSSLDHFELEILRDKQKRGEISDYDAHKTLLAEIKETNFDRYVEENFSNKQANRFLALST